MKTTEQQPVAAPQGVHVTINNQGGQQNGTLERNHLVAILLAVFVGWLGIDRFYLGSAGVGLLKLFTFGLFGVLWIIDIIMIATKSVKGVTWEVK